MFIHPLLSIEAIPNKGNGVRVKLQPSSSSSSTSPSSDPQNIIPAKSLILLEAPLATQPCQTRAEGLESLARQWHDYQTAHPATSTYPALCHDSPSSVSSEEKLSPLQQARAQVRSNAFATQPSRDLDKSNLIYCLFPKASYFNHSCEPNACIFRFPPTEPTEQALREEEDKFLSQAESPLADLAGASDRDRKTERERGRGPIAGIFALRDLNPGEEIEISYNSQHLAGSTYLRRLYLLQSHSFWCRCVRCERQGEVSSAQQGEADVEEHIPEVTAHDQTRRDAGWAREQLGEVMARLGVSELQTQSSGYSTPQECLQFITACETFLSEHSPTHPLLASLSTGSTQQLNTDLMSNLHISRQNQNFENNENDLLYGYMKVLKLKIGALLYFHKILKPMVTSTRNLHLKLGHMLNQLNSSLPAISPDNTSESPAPPQTAEVIAIQSQLLKVHKTLKVNQKKYKHILTQESKCLIKFQKDALVLIKLESELFGAYSSDRIPLVKMYQDHLPILTNCTRELEELDSSDSTMSREQAEKSNSGDDSRANSDEMIKTLTSGLDEEWSELKELYIDNAQVNQLVNNTQ